MEILLKLMFLKLLAGFSKVIFLVTNWKTDNATMSLRRTLDERHEDPYPVYLTVYT